MRRWLTRAMRARLVVLLALALGLRLLAPEGWMPAAGGRLMLCPGADRAMAMPGHQRGRDEPARAADHPCAFAQAAAVAPPPGPLGWAPPPLQPRPTPAARLPVAIGRGLAAPPPPATGPPAFA